MAKISNQTGRILDAISAGPIEGLVNGNASVFLDDSAVARRELIDNDNKTPTETLNMTASFVEGSSVVTVPKTTELESLIGNLSNDFPRFLWLEGAGRKLQVAVYGGVGVGYETSNESGGGKNNTAKSNGGLGGKAIQFYDFHRRERDDDEEGDDDPTQSDAYLKAREIIDLKKFYEDDTAIPVPQTNVSEIKQTFTVNLFESNFLASYRELGRSEPVVSADMTRKHFFRGISTYTYGDHPLSGAFARFHSSKNYDDISDAVQGKFLNLTNTNANAEGRIGFLGNEGEHPEATNLYTGGNFRTDFLLFDGVYKIVSLQLAADVDFIEITIDTSTSSSSFKPRAPYRTRDNVRAHVFTVGGENVDSGSTLRGNIKFKTGDRNQSEVTALEGSVAPPRTNVIINPNTTLLLSNSFTNGTSTPTIYTSSGSSGASLGLSALQTKQIDAIRLNIVFPNGLFAIEKDGDYIDGLFDAVIRFRHRNSTSEEFKEVLVRGTEKLTNYWENPSNSQDTADLSQAISGGIGMRVAENKKANFSREVVIDVARFYPFVDFEIEIERQTPDKYDDYMEGNRINDSGDNEVKSFSGSAIVQYVQALFYDKFTYPLTAYAAVTFSGADFDKIPTRGYHCRGLKIPVPSNYITREEDALVSGEIGIARYSRTVSGFNKTTTTQDVDNQTILTNTLTFILDAGELDINRPDGSYDVGYWKNKQYGGSTEHAANISPNVDDLIISFYNSDPDKDGSLSHTSNIQVRFNPNYKLHGTNFNLYQQLDSFTVTDIISQQVLTYDTSHSFFDENSEFPGISISQSNYDATLPSITAGRSYTVVMNFKSNVVRPNNYELWDGSFRSRVYCNNPAWIYLDILTQPEYGLGDFLKLEDVDIYELYEIARHCDELVPDGKGGLEPRFTCNVYLNKPTEAYQLLKDLASTFRGMSVWQNSKIIPIQDRPKSSVYLFTQANVIDGIFTYSRQSIRAMPNSIECTWNDPEQQYRQDVIVLDDTQAQLKAGRVISKKIVAFGCTSKGQAKRVAEWHLATNQLETKRVSFSTSINASLLQVGDIVSLQDHQASSRIQTSGRIKTAPARDILILDREVTLDFTNHSYVIFVQIVDSVFICRQRTAIINGVTYNLGDIIKTDNLGNLLTGSTYNSDEVVDDSNESVKTEKTKRTSVIQKEILPSQTETSDTVFLSSEIEMLQFQELLDVDAPPEDFDGLDVVGTIDALLKEHIWAISKNDVTDDSIEKYRIMSIKPEQDGFNTNISGLQYEESKFAKTDVNNAAFSDPFYNSALAATVISAPVNGHAALVAALKV